MAELVSEDSSHIIKIYINQEEESTIYVDLSKSEDGGFFYKSPCEEAEGLKLEERQTFEETRDYIKQYFLDKNYKFKG